MCVRFLQSDLPDEEEEEGEVEGEVENAGSDSLEKADGSAAQSTVPMPSETSQCIFESTQRQTLETELQGLNVNDPLPDDVKANITPALELPSKDPDSCEDPAVVGEPPA